MVHHGTESTSIFGLLSALRTLTQRVHPPVCPAQPHPCRVLVGIGAIGRTEIVGMAPPIGADLAASTDQRSEATRADTRCSGRHG